ncbi:hypothetical protein Tco_0443607, partial [Tanacetum coccineum]
FDVELEEPMKDQPLSVDASPTALSPGHIADSNPEEDKEDPEEDPEKKSSDDDNDDDVEKDEEEEEHLAPADPSTVPTDNHVPSS